MFRLLVFLGITLSCAVFPAHSELSHKVEKGETLFALSREYGVSLNQILAANPGLNPQSLKVGQNIRIPQSSPPEPLKPVVRPVANSNSSPDPVAAAVPKAPANDDLPKGAYRVRPGDTLSKIADQFDTTTSKLRVWNDLPSDKVVLGRILRVIPPDAAPAKKAVTPVVKVTSPVSPAKPVVGEGKAVRDQDNDRESDSSSKDPDASGSPKYFFVSKVKQQIDAPIVKKGRWKYIVVHHSGTKNGNLKIFDYYHRHRGMENGVAYHFVIGNGTDSGDGEIEVTNRWKQQLQGGHLASEELNQIALGICLVGDFNKTRPTRKQIAALVELIDYIERKTGPKPRFMVHREINPKPTDCPGKYFPVAAMHRLFDGKD